ncbi:MAG: putative integrase/recombinase y4qK [Limisphaerales bacterium]|nr:MAG: putative integrase/recombinase y4qK [Limisphaerales bacterium]
MGELKEKMARDLALRNLAAGTQKQYLSCCCNFVRYHMVSPRKLGLGDIKDFLGQLLREAASPQKLKMHVAGIKFLYGTTLDRQQVADKIPWPKVADKKPDILSGTETEKLLAAVGNLKTGVVLTTAYAAGLRIGEACRLKPEDIDSKRGLIKVLGKGNKERYVMLSERLLVILRAYWKQTQPKGDWLFPGGKNGKPLTASAVAKALAFAVKKAKLRKHVTPHTLRHSFATHLLETGTDIRVIQKLLGHGSIHSTAHYTQVSRLHIATVKSPMDLLGTKRAAAMR